MAEATVFEGIQIADDDEGMPKRIVAGRESIPNPFVDVVKSTYDAWKKDPAKATTKSFTVPVSKKLTNKDMTMRTQVRRNSKTGEVEDVQQWQGHPNVTSAIYLLRQAADKHGIGVRILPDWKESKVNGVTVTHKDDDGNTIEDGTFDEVTRHTFDVKDGHVRIRFIGQDKKKKNAKDDDNPEASNEGVARDTSNA